MPQRVTRPTLAILSFLVAHYLADRDTWGFEITSATGLKSGTVYPALARLESEGLVTSSWDESDTPGPRRRIYRLTATGARRAAVLLKGDTPDMPDIERFWRRRGDSPQLDADGFLIDPNVSLGRVGLNPEAISTAELAGATAVVMLGEMGAGKSTVLERPELLVPAGIQILAINLALYGSEDRLAREVLRHPLIEEWKVGVNELALVFDSFDEAQERIPQLGQMLASEIRSWPTERLVLRIASRTVDWSLLLEDELGRVFDDAHVVEMLPLRHEDARAIAAEQCDEPAAFLKAVTNSKASAFASRPQTLRMLATIFQNHGTLPERVAELYDKGTRSLADESNKGRREARLAGSLTVDERIAVARRVGAALTFSGAAAIWAGPDEEAGSDDLIIRSLAGGEEPTAAGAVVVTEAAAREVLATGLFTSRGPNRFGFAHASFGDYLTASWIEANDLTIDKVRALLVSPAGQAWPQLRVTAAWLVAVAPERFAWLATDDPESFRGEVDLPGDQLRASVVDGMFQNASRIEHNWSDRLSGLNHPTIAEQVRPHLTDGSFDEKRLAIKLVRDCQISELRPELVRIALHGAESDGLRTIAGFAAIAVDANHPLNDLVTLVTEPAVRGADELNDLLGVGLIASWPHAIGTAAVFSQLIKPSRRFFYGAYRTFIADLAKGLQPQDLPSALVWLEEHVEEIDSGDLEDLADSIIRLAAAHIDSNVAAALARIAITRAANYKGLLFGRRHRSDDIAVLAADVRRRVVNAILDQTTDHDVALYLSDRPARGSGLIGPEDLEWLLGEAAATAAGNRLDAIDLLFRSTFDGNRRDHAELFLDLDEQHPIRRLHQDWLQIEIGSETAKKMKQMHELINDREPDEEVSHDEVNNQIVDVLERIESGTPELFPHLGRGIATHVGGTTTVDTEVDLAATPRWHGLGPAEKDRIVAAARAYLDTQLCDADAWVDDPTVLHFASYAGYRALLLLLRLDRMALDQLPAAAWREWAPVIVSMVRSIDGPTWEDKRQLLRRADPHAHKILVAALIRRIRATAAAGLHFLWDDEVDFLFDEDLEQALAELAEEAHEPASHGLTEALARNRPEVAVPLLRSILAEEDSAPRSRRITASVALLDHDLAGSWALLKARFDPDAELALEAFGQARITRGRQVESNLPEDLLADLYLWLRQNYPPAEDPDYDGTHFIGPREAVGELRDRILATLRDKGTLAATEALAGIAAAHPSDTWLQRVQTSAMTAYARNEWLPMKVGDLVRLAEQGRSALVNTERDLQMVVVRALGDIQRELTGANPQSHLLWDTHSHRPKSEDEVSDHLRNRLVEQTGGKRLVVNREVQIRRNRTSGMPERADIQVDAAVGTTGARPVLTLPIEVKGAWHDDVLTAMRSQLMEQYMADLGGCYGCYVVLWPDSVSWTDSSDARRAKMAARDRNAVIAELASQAEALRADGVFIEVVHIDMSYLRPCGE